MLHPNATTSRRAYAEIKQGRVAISPPRKKKTYMLRWAAIFLIIAIIAAIFGFGGVAGTAIGIAKVLFFIFIAICVVLFLLGLFAGRGV